MLRPIILALLIPCAACLSPEEFRSGEETQPSCEESRYRCLCGYSPNEVEPLEEKECASCMDNCHIDEGVEECSVWLEGGAKDPCGVSFDLCMMALPYTSNTSCVVCQATCTEDFAAKCSVMASD